MHARVTGSDNRLEPGENKQPLSPADLEDRRTFLRIGLVVICVTLVTLGLVTISLTLA